MLLALVLSLAVIRIAIIPIDGISYGNRTTEHRTIYINNRTNNNETEFKNISSTYNTSQATAINWIDNFVEAIEALDNQQVNFRIEFDGNDEYGESRSDHSKRLKKRQSEQRLESNEVFEDDENLQNELIKR